MPGTPGNDTNLIKAEKIVTILLEKNIKLVALDFDCTLIDIHTSGSWRQGAKTLVSHIRPCFKNLLPTLLKHNIFVSIATYSAQPDLIQELLHEAFPDSPTDKVVIQASTKDWVTQQRQDGHEILGKEQHIASIITILYHRYHAIIGSEEILLLDDSLDNVRTAVEFRHRGFQIKDDVTLDSLKRYVSCL